MAVKTHQYPGMHAALKKSDFADVITDKNNKLSMIEFFELFSYHSIAIV